MVVPNLSASASNGAETQTRTFGRGATVLKGTRIGRHSIVGANAVVTRPVEPGQTIVAPASKPLEQGPPEISR